MEEYVATARLFAPSVRLAVVRSQSKAAVASTTSGAGTDMMRRAVPRVCGVADRSIAARQRRDEQVKERIAQKLVDSGEKERLKELLREKLASCGWRDEMKAYCKGPGVDCICDGGIEFTNGGVRLCASRGDPEQGH